LDRSQPTERTTGDISKYLCAQEDLDGGEKYWLSRARQETEGTMLPHRAQRRDTAVDLRSNWTLSFSTSRKDDSPFEARLGRWAILRICGRRELGMLVFAGAAILQCCDVSAVVLTDTSCDVQCDPREVSSRLVFMIGTSVYAHVRRHAEASPRHRGARSGVRCGDGMHHAVEQHRHRGATASESHVAAPIGRVFGTSKSPEEAPFAAADEA
jgi:hypothetical protein